MEFHIFVVNILFTETFLFPPFVEIYHPHILSYVI